MLNEKRSMTAAKEGRESSKYLMHCKADLFTYRIYSHPSVSMTDWFQKPQRIPKSADAQVPYSQLAPRICGFCIHPYRGPTVFPRGAYRTSEHVRAHWRRAHTTSHTRRGFWPGHLRVSSSAHTRPAECPHPLWPCVPRSLQGAPRWRAADSQFIQAVLWLFQPVAVEKIVIYFVVLDAGIGGHSSCGYFPHGHAKCPLRTKRQRQDASLSRKAEWTFSLGKVISLEPRRSCTKLTIMFEIRCSPKTAIMWGRNVTVPHFY